MKRLYFQPETENDENRPTRLETDKEYKTKEKLRKRAAGYERNNSSLVRRRVLRILLVAAVIVGSIVKSGLLTAIEVVVIALFGSPN